jgi:Dolichyl-phosphate-mannose-protein mannosyltransferase
MRLDRTVTTGKTWDAGGAPSDANLRHAVGWADRQAARIERRGTLLFLGLSGAYWALTWIFATRKLMWNDELYTFYIARLPSMSDVLAALMSRGEQTPPFFYAITRLAFALFGVNELSIRLPEMIAFWVLSACLFVIVSSRMSALSGLCAAAFPLVTTAYYYAFEARPYALVLAFGGLGLLCWQSATSNRHRLAAVGGLALALSATVSTHYYGVFVVLALALGEAVRTLSRRHLDVAVWAALAMPAVPLAFHLPLIRAGTAYSGAFWSPPQWVNVPDFYTDLLEPAVMPLTVLLIVAALVGLASTEPPAADGARPLPPLHEVAAAFGLIVIPVICVVLAKLVTGAFVNRYAITAVIGFAVFAGFGAGMAFGRRPAMRLIAVTCLGCWFVLLQARELVQPTGLTLPVSRVSVDRLSQWVRATPHPNLPLVVADPQTFTELSHYGAPDIRQRIVYLADPDLALKHRGTNSVERGMLDLVRPWFRMHVVPFRPFIEQHDRFLVYGDFVRLSFLNWLLPELHARGMHTRLLNGAGNNLFLLAYRDTASPLATGASAASVRSSR